MIDASRIVNESERIEMVQLLTFMTGRPAVFYTKMTVEQLHEEYDRLSSVDEK